MDQCVEKTKETEASDGENGHGAARNPVANQPAFTFPQPLLHAHDRGVRCRAYWELSLLGAERKASMKSHADWPRNIQNSSSDFIHQRFGCFPSDRCFCSWKFDQRRKQTRNVFRFTPTRNEIKSHLKHEFWLQSDDALVKRVSRSSCELIW